MDFTHEPATTKSFASFLNLLDTSSAKFSRTNVQNSALQNNEAILANSRSWKLLQDQDLYTDIELNDLINLVSLTLQELKEISGSYVLKTFRHPENSIPGIFRDKSYVTNNSSSKNSMHNLMSLIYTEDFQTTPIYTDARSIGERENNYSKDYEYVDNGEEDLDLVKNIMKSSTMLDSLADFNGDRTFSKNVWNVREVVNEKNRSYPLELDENDIERKRNDNSLKLYNTRCLESTWDSKFARSFSPINIKNQSNNLTSQDRPFPASPVRCINMEEEGETFIPTHDRIEMNNLLEESITTTDVKNPNFQEIMENTVSMNVNNGGIVPGKIQGQSSLNCLNNLRKDTNVLIDDKKLIFNQASLKSISDTGYITDDEAGRKISQLDFFNGFTTSKICNVDQETSQLNFTNEFIASTGPCVGFISECQTEMVNGENLLRNKRDNSNIRNREKLVKGNRKTSPPKRTSITDTKNKNFKHNVVNYASKQMTELLPYKCNEKLSSKYNDKISNRIKDTIRHHKIIETQVKPLINLKETINSVNNPKVARTKVSMKSEDSKKASKDNNRLKNKKESVNNISQKDKRILKEPSGVIKKCANNDWEKMTKPASLNIRKTSQESKLTTKGQGNIETRLKIPVGRSCGDIQNSITPCKRFQTPQSIHKISSTYSGKESVTIRSLGEKPFNHSDIAASQDLLSKDNRNLIDLEENRITKICQCLAETKAQQRHKSSSSKELSIVTESQSSNDKKNQCFSNDQSAVPSKRCESATFGKSSEINVNKQKSNSKIRTGTSKRFSMTKVGQTSLQNINERFEKPKVIKMLEELINNTPEVLEENNLSNNTEKTKPHFIKLSVTSLQNNDLNDRLNSNNKINSCIKCLSFTNSRPRNNKVYKKKLYDTDTNDSDTLPIKLSTKYINVTSNAQFSESQTDTDMEELFKNHSKKSVGLQKETDYSSSTDGREYTIDSKTVTDTDHSRSNVRLTLKSFIDLPWGSEFTSDYSTNVSTYAKECQTSLTSLLSSSKTLQIGILQDCAIEGTVQKETCENSQESLSGIRKTFSENCTKSNQSFKKQFVNKHAKSLHVLKEILKCQELSVDFLNAAERELKKELHDEIYGSEREIYINTNLLETSRIESRSQHSLNIDISDCTADLEKQRNSNKLIDSEKSIENMQPERLDRDACIVFSNGVKIRNYSCSPCKINNCFEGNEIMSKVSSNIVEEVEPVSLVCTKSKETSCKLRTVTEEEEISCKPEDFPFLRKEITTQAPFTREVFTESEFHETIYTQTGQCFSLKDIAISSEDHKESIIKESKSTSCDTIPNYQTVGIECTERLNMIYNSTTVNTDHVITSKKKMTVFQKSISTNACTQVDDVSESKKLVTDTFTETLKPCYSFDVAKDTIEEEELNRIIILSDDKSNNKDRSYQRLFLNFNDTSSAYTTVCNSCIEKMSTFPNNDYLKEQASEDVFVQFQSMSKHNQNLDEEINRKRFSKSCQNVCRENSFFHLFQAISVASFDIQETRNKKANYNRLEKPIELSLNLNSAAASSNDTSIKFVTNSTPLPRQITLEKVLPKLKKNGSGDGSTTRKGPRESKKDEKALWNKDKKIESLQRKRIKDYIYSKCSLFSRQQLFACIYAVLCSIVFCSLQFSHFCES